MVLTEDQKLQRSKWFKSRPKKVQKAILKYPPYQKYRLKDTEQIVYLYSYFESEKGECTECQILVLQKDNPSLSFDRRVFGIKLEDLDPILMN